MITDCCYGDCCLDHQYHCTLHQSDHFARCASVYVVVSPTFSHTLPPDQGNSTPTTSRCFTLREEDVTNILLTYGRNPSHFMEPKGTFPNSPKKDSCSPSRSRCACRTFAHHQPSSCTVMWSARTHVFPL